MAIRPIPLLRDRRGATIVEFAFVAPMLLLLLLGAIDAGHTLYMRSVLQGTVQKVARDASLETGGSTSQQLVLDDQMRTAVRNLMPYAEIDITRTNFRRYSSAANGGLEEFTDTNNNGICDNNEPYQDDNNSGTRDAVGSTGQGGAKDATILKVTVKYDHLLPIGGLVRFFSRSASYNNKITLEGTTVLKNQPYGDQTIAIGHCT